LSSNAKNTFNRGERRVFQTSSYLLLPSSCFLSLFLFLAAVKYKLAIFDFDGTLADSFPFLLGLADELADKYHIKRPRPAEQEILRGYNAHQVLKHLEVPWWKVPLLAHEFRTAMARDIDRIKLFEGVDQLFQRLTSLGIILAIISSNSYKNIRHVLGTHNAARVSYYECGVSLLGKAAKIRKVLRQSRVKPNEAILIGDEIRDGEAARQAQIAFGAVAWGYTRLEALQAQAPSVVFVNMEEIGRELT
jgi:phosphoglycolate phosphatase